MMNDECKSVVHHSSSIIHHSSFEDSMDAAAAAMKPVRINRWLPYWAVFQADVRQTLGSWVYRVWVIMSVLAAVGYLLYKLGAFHLAGLQQSDAVFISDLLRWTVLGSVTLIIVLTVGCIS